jgi:hypothetical protein
MKVFKKTLLPALLTAISGKAEINARKGSYEVDQGLDLKNVRLKLKYSSRSDHHGLFGYGWCSDLDVSLKRTADDRVFLNHCGEVQELTPEQRTTKYKFTNAGDLSEFQADGKVVKVKSLSAHKKILSSGKHVWVVSLDRRTLQVTSIKVHEPMAHRAPSSENPNYEFTYQGELLTSVRSRDQATDTFTYNGDKNMVEAKSGRETVDYDKTLDRVKLVRIGPCQTEVVYETLRAKPAVEIQQRCNSRRVYRRRHIL